jgi:hypothetical protein
MGEGKSREGSEVRGKGRIL